MHDEVKQLADTGNVKRLRYVFSDCLDVDPSFQEYEEDFRYCKEKGIFESHVERTSFRMDPSTWNVGYWTALKGDLVANLSVERLSHMRKVANVLFKDRMQPQKAAKSDSIRTEAAASQTASSEWKFAVKRIAPENDMALKQQHELEAKRRRFAENEKKKETLRASSPVTPAPLPRRPAPSKKAPGVPAWMLFLPLAAAIIVLYFLLR